MILLPTAGARARGLHLGIPTASAPDVTNVQLQTPELGWTAQVPGGWARVYVGPTEADAEAWYTRALVGLTRPAAPAAGIGDVSAGDGQGLLVFRDGNVAVMVHTETNARGVADTLHAAIADGPTPWPPPPEPKQGADGRWTVTLPAGAEIRATGGRPVPFQVGVYTELPAEIVVWDAWGRPAVWHQPATTPRW